MQNKNEQSEFVELKLMDVVQQFGEEEVKEILSNFSCPRNLDVEKFIREDAIAFSKKRQSITYLVFSLQEMKLARFYSIAIKPVTIPAAAISKNLAKRAARIGSFDETTQTYSTAMYLIAQLGKNSQYGKAESLGGRELLAFATAKISELSHLAGGTLQFLECEDVDFLKHFYEENNFAWFGARIAEREDGDGHLLHQYIRKID